MPRTFYTEHDIQDLAKRGVTEIEVNDAVTLTDAAREMMDKLGIARKVTHSAHSSNHSALTDAEREQVIDKVKSGVIARLGAGVDSAVVDRIVRRVVSAL